MSYDLVIQSENSDVSIALLKDKKLVELHKEKSGSGFAVGDIYLGRVKKIMPGLNAAFVDVGYEKDAFLHYLDLGPQVNSFLKFAKQTQKGKQNHFKLDYFRMEKDINKSGKINEVLNSNQQILVQVAKEPISTKGPRVSSEISIAGRYLVLIPFSDKVSISQKIKSNSERDRLRKLMHGIKPKNFGVIIRTVAENKDVELLHQDINDLMKKWEACYKQLKEANAPQRVLGEMNRASAMVRDMLNANFNNIYVENEVLFEEIREYVERKAPDREKIVQIYKGRNGIFEHFGIERQIKASFGKNVNFGNGAYLVIEHTEAMHVIDVNSGPRTDKSKDQEANALECNLSAAKEVARQLRLRDMGGIIVVDFIDLHKAQNRKELHKAMKQEMKEDKAKHSILPPSKFGLVQITRQRVRPEMAIKTVEECPTCGGSGEVEATILFTDELENSLRFILQEQNEDAVSLTVHPYIGAYLTKGFPSRRMKWMWEYKKRIDINTSTSLHLLEYHFYNKAGEEIKI